MKKLREVASAIDSGDVGLILLSLGAAFWRFEAGLVVLGFALVIGQRPLRKWWRED